MNTSIQVPAGFRGYVIVAAVIADEAMRRDPANHLALSIERRAPGGEWDFVCGLTWQGNDAPLPRGAHPKAATGPVLHHRTHDPSEKGEFDWFTGYEVRAVTDAAASMGVVLETELKPVELLP